jgi:hypothetical protein
MLLPLAGGGASTGSDPRLKKALDKTGLKYTETDDGDFKLLFEVNDGRSQFVWAESNTETIGQFEVREVWAAGWKNSSRMDSEDMARLLKENSSTKIGAWEMLFEDGTYYAVFTAKIPAVLPADELETILRWVAAKADKLEDDLMDSDDL